MEKILLLNKDKSSRVASMLLPWIVCLTGGLLFFYEFIQLNLMNSLNPFISNELNLTPQAISTISSMYFISNASLVFVAGNCLDRFSNKTCILWSMFLCTIGTLGFSFANSAWEMSALRLIIGIGGAFCFISAFRLATRWFAHNKLSFITGLIVTMAMTGGMLAQQPAVSLMQNIGWRNAMLYNAALGVVIMILMLIFIKDAPNIKALRLEQQQLKNLKIWPIIKVVLTNIRIWAAALYGSLLNLAVFIIGALWGTRYLVTKYGISLDQASHICGMIYLGSMLGCPLIGFLADYFNKAKPLMLVFAIASLGILLIILYGELNYYQLSITFFGLGLLTSSQILAYPLAANQTASNLQGASASIVSTCMELLPAIFQPIFGYLLTIHAAKRLILPTKLNVSDYTFSLNMLVLGFIISIVIATWINLTNKYEKN